MRPATRTLATLHAELRDRIGVETLARSLVPDLTRTGSTLRADSLAGNTPSGPRQAFSIFLTGPRAGHWQDFASGQRGDLIDLIAHTQTITIPEAARRARGLLDSPDALGKPATRPGAERPRQAGRTPEQAKAAARRLWESARPIAGSLAASYLEQGRGLSGPFPDELRYHPNLMHGPTSRAYPGLLGAVRSPAGQVSGLIRIYLAEDGRSKAAIRLPKTMLGACAGGAVRLDAVAPILAICEGIETGLAIRQAFNGRLPVWACGTVANMAALVLPEGVTTVIHCQDSNPPGSRAAEAAERALAAHRAAGIDVRKITPRSGSDFLDQFTTHGAQDVRRTIQEAI